MKLVIFGSTGSIGSHVVEQALSAGHTVTAFVRNPGKLNVQHPNLNIFTGDVMNPALVEEAVIGHEAAICILGSGKKLSGNVRSRSASLRLIAGYKKHHSSIRKSRNQKIYLSVNSWCGG